MTVKDYRYWEPTVDTRVYRGFSYALPNLRDRITDFRLEDARGMYDKAELSLNNNDGRLFDLNSLALGVVFKLTYGYVEALATPRIMQCRKMNGAARIGGLGQQSGPNTAAGGIVKLQLNSMLWSKNLSRALVNKTKSTNRNLTIERDTVPNNVRRFAKIYGFDDDQIHIENLSDEPLLVENTIPARASLTEWINELAKRRGWIFKIDAEGFHFHSRDFEYPFVDGDDIIDLTWFDGSPDVIEWSIDGDINVPQGVQVAGGSIRDEVNFGQAEVSHADRISFALRNQKSTASSRAISPDLLFSASNPGRVPEKLERFLWSAADRWKLNIKLVGNPRVRWGKKLNLRNFGPLVDGLWRVTKAVHTIRPNDVYFTEIGVRRSSVIVHRGKRKTNLANTEIGSTGETVSFAITEN
jgi:hypothetical protein